MSHDSVVMIMGVFEKQFGKKYGRSFLKSQENLQNGKNLTLMSHRSEPKDVITSGTKFLKHFGGNLPSYKKSSF